MIEYLVLLLRRQNKMWINKFKLVLVLVTLSCCVSCHKEVKFRSDKALLSAIDYDVIVQNANNKITFCICIENKTQTELYIPIGDWIADGKYDERRPSLTQPMETGILNTLYFYPKGSNVFDARVDVGWRGEESFALSFYIIKPKQKKWLILNLPKSYKHNSKVIETFKNNIEYKFEIKMGIISKENFDILFNNKVKEKEIEISNINYDFIYNNANFSNIHKPVNNGLFLNKEESENLNILANNKLTIYFDYTYRQDTLSK